MKNTYGNSISLTLFGESHGEYIGAVLDGVAPGIKVDLDLACAMLSLRRPRGKISTARVETDEFKIASGVFNGYTTGTPIAILIPNTNKKSSDYEKISKIPRPGHADYTATCKYHGFEDGRGGGHFSGRITAALVAAGAILYSALKDKGIYIGTHISSLHGVNDRVFSDYEADIEALSTKYFPVLDENAGEKMNAEIESAAANGDSVGGILESAVIGLPAGVGEPWFDSLEGLLSHALFSIGGVKGVEFGLGFGFAEKYGSEVNDKIRTDGAKVYTETNFNGGINGGITNGMPVIFRTAIKPTPSIFREQGSVDLTKMENVTLKIEGRHDPAIIHRARVVVDAVTALVVADALTMRFGTDYLSNCK